MAEQHSDSGTTPTAPIGEVHEREPRGPLNISDLVPLLETIVQQALAAFRDHDPTLGSHRLAYLEPEAASLFGVKKHVIRDARLRGELTSTRVGGRIAYTREELVNYLDRQRV